MAGHRAKGQTAKNRSGVDGAHRSVQPSTDLAAMIGDTPLTRSEAVRKIWAYIKDHKLQNPSDRRQILPDEKLQKIVGKGQISMFEMNKHLFANLHPVDG